MSFRIEINFSVSVVNQEYRVAVHEESVVLSNDVIFKCNIQSHVTDLVIVSGWVNSEGETFSSSGDNYGNCHERRILREDDLGISLSGRSHATTTICTCPPFVPFCQIGVEYKFSSAPLRCILLAVFFNRQLLSNSHLGPVFVFSGASGLQGGRAP